MKSPTNWYLITCSLYIHLYQEWNLLVFFLFLSFFFLSLFLTFCVPSDTMNCYESIRLRHCKPVIYGLLNDRLSNIILFCFSQNETFCAFIFLSVFLISHSILVISIVETFYWKQNFIFIMTSELVFVMR